MPREEDKAEFNYKLGYILRPVLDVVESPNDYSEAQRRQARGRFLSDVVELNRQLSNFCAEPGAHYEQEMGAISMALSALRNMVSTSMVALPLPPGLEDGIATARTNLLQAIAAVPISTESAIYDAHTPFTSYLRLKTLCDTATRQIVCADRYLDETIFHRQLAGIPAHVEVVLIIRPSSLTAAFLDVSRLYATERATTYRLLKEPKFHDRWLKCDDRMYSLGGSLKQAGSATVYTVAPLKSTPEELAEVDQLISRSTELFGPANPVHP